MKKALFILATGVIFSTTQAQVITNGSFETWVDVGGSVDWERPEGFHASDKTLNDMSTLLALSGYPITPENQMTRNEDITYEGDYSVQLTSKFLGASLGVVPCLMANGNIVIDVEAAMEGLSGSIEGIEEIIEVNGGTPVLGKVADSLVVYVNVPVANEDSSAIIVQAKKNIDGTVVVIGSGFAGIAAEEGFQRIKVDIEYEDDEVRSTDTVVVMVISSSNVPEDEEIFGATDDNAIYVDQMSLYVSEESSGIHSLEKADLGIDVYPNPATSQVNFRNERVKNGLLNIFAVDGKLMHQHPLKEGVNTVELSAYPSGMYHYELVDTDLNQRQTGSFVK